MKNFIALILLSVSFAATAVAQGGAILQIQGPGGTHTAPLDPQGNANILGVKPGTYQVALLVPAVQKVRDAANRSTSASDDKHKNWIDIESWSWGASYVGSANGGVWKTTDGGAAKREASAPSISEVVVTKNQDASSPALMKAVKPKRGQLTNKTNHGGTEYYKIELENILVSSVQGSGGDRPMESLSLNFTKITYK